MSIYDFIRKNILLNKNIFPIIQHLYIFFIKPKFLCNVRVIDRFSMLESMSKGASLIRFGDGELSIMSGNNPPEFQKYSNKLSGELNQVFDSKEQNLIICIPNPLVSRKSYDQLIPRAKYFWLRFLNANYDWLNCRINKHTIYGDTEFSRPYIDTLDRLNNKVFFNKFKQTINGRDIAIIEGADTKFGVGNDLLNSANSVTRIIGPSVNAYESLHLLIPEILKIPKRTLIFVALGPASKPLALTLYKQNYQVWDLGHLDLEYEWFLRNAKEKILIPGKYVNENPIHLNSSETLPSSVLKRYENEIVFKLK